MISGGGDTMTAMFGQPSAELAAQLKSDETDEIASDVFGTTTYDSLNNVHINDALLQMRQGLINMPQTETMAVLNAQRKRPEIVDDQNMLKFLLAEKFNISNALTKFVRYWNDRYKLFGADKFVMDITLQGAMKDDSLALSRGYVQILPETDTAGRTVCYIDWSSHEPSVGYTEESMHRVFWYMMHVAMQDTNILQRGIVLLIYPQEARLDQFDHSLWTSISSSLKYALPIPWRSTHIVHPNRFFSIIHPVFMSSVPRDVQDRVVVHSGTKMKVLANLLRYCLPWDRTPSEIGGCVDLDFELWLTQRMEKEVESAKAAAAIEITRSGTTSAHGLLSEMMPEQMKSNSNASASFLNHPMFSNEDESTPRKYLSTKPTVAKASKGLVVKSGRKSDPRMDKAVQAKLDDPSLPLLDALREGGFIFPAIDDTNTPQYAVVDSDNVKITQRKNQLLRRIRTAKKKAGII